MDLIDRQDAIDVLSMMQGIVAENGVRKGISMAWQQIKDLPTANVIEAPGWIPVSERLPEVNEQPYYDDGHEILYESDPVLVYAIDRNFSTKERLFGIGMILEDRCDEKSTYWDGCLYPDGEISPYHPEDVIAWMPLPEPYREEATDGIFH